MNKEQMKLDLRTRLEVLDERAMACFNQMQALQVDLLDLVLQMRDTTHRLKKLEAHFEREQFGKASPLRCAF